MQKIINIRNLRSNFTARFPRDSAARILSQEPDFVSPEAFLELARALLAVVGDDSMDKKKKG
jgi:hypothetical protein